MLEEKTFSLTSNRYGLSIAQFKTLLDWMVQGEKILVLSPNLQSTRKDFKEVLDQIYPDRLYPTKIMARDRIITCGNSVVYFMSHSADVFNLRCLCFTRCIVTGVLDKKRADHFVQEYYFCTLFDKRKRTKMNIIEEKIET